MRSNKSRTGLHCMNTNSSGDIDNVTVKGDRAMHGFPCLRPPLLYLPLRLAPVRSASPSPSLSPSPGRWRRDLSAWPPACLSAWPPACLFVLFCLSVQPVYPHTPPYLLIICVCSHHTVNRGSFTPTETKESQWHVIYYKLHILWMSSHSNLNKWIKETFIFL